MNRSLLLSGCLMMAWCLHACGGEIQSRSWSRNDGISDGTIAEEVRYTWVFAQPEKAVDIRVYRHAAIAISGWSLKFAEPTKDTEPMKLSQDEAKEALSGVLAEFARGRPGEEITSVALTLEQIPELMAEVTKLLGKSLASMPGKIEPKSQSLRQAMIGASKQVLENSSLMTGLRNMGYDIVKTDTWDHVPIDLSMVGKPWTDLVKPESFGLKKPQIIVLNIKRKSDGK